jgi:hypothetical protein
VPNGSVGYNLYWAAAFAAILFLICGLTNVDCLLSVAVRSVELTANILLTGWLPCLIAGSVN